MQVTSKLQWIWYICVHYHLFRSIKSQCCWMSQNIAIIIINRVSCSFSKLKAIIGAVAMAILYRCHVLCTVSIHHIGQVWHWFRMSDWLSAITTDAIWWLCIKGQENVYILFKVPMQSVFQFMRLFKHAEKLNSSL